MNRIEYVLPEEIEKRSFEIIGDELKHMGISISPDKEFLVKRVIHTTADFDYASSLRFSADAVEKAKALLKSGCTIVTDTNMTLSGISKPAAKKLGVELRCFMSEENTMKLAKERGETRASVSMELASKLKGPVIFSVGNAPTALITLRDMLDKGIYRPAFVIGVPVGFVNVEVAKELIMETDIPHIVNVGRKGGSTVAAAIINALMYSIVRG